MFNVSFDLFMSCLIAAVSPFLLANVKNKEVKIVFDAALEKVAEKLAFRGGQSDKTILIPAADIKKYMDALGLDYKVIDVSAMAKAAPAKPASKPAKGIQTNTSYKWLTISSGGPAKTKRIR
jgi:hypothetical protein